MTNDNITCNHLEKNSKYIELPLIAELFVYGQNKIYKQLKHEQNILDLSKFIEIFGNSFKNDKTFKELKKLVQELNNNCQKIGPIIELMQIHRNKTPKQILKVIKNGKSEKEK